MAGDHHLSVHVLSERNLQSMHLLHLSFLYPVAAGFFRVGRLRGRGRCRDRSLFRGGHQRIGREIELSGREIGIGILLKGGVLGMDGGGDDLEFGFGFEFEFEGLFYSVSIMLLFSLFFFNFALFRVLIL